MERRDLLKLLAVTGAGATAGGAIFASNRAANAAAYRIVVVGGGMAGTTAAKYLRLWGGALVDVTLITKEAQYTSNIMSNMVLTGERTLSELKYGYSALSTKYGVKVLTDEVLSVDPTARTVNTGINGSLPYDRLVMAAGLEFDPTSFGPDFVSDWNPHAWQAGPQTQLLHDHLASVPDGGTVLITIPAAPYRCPPGPYERACVLADLLVRTGRPNAKVVVLDANAAIQAEAPRFSEAFAGGSGYHVDYRPNSTNVRIVSTESGGGTVTYFNGTDSITIQADVVNAIPQQKAPTLLSATGLTDSSRFAPIDPRSFESTLVPAIHVIGDSCKTAKPGYGNVPKAGHIANQEAKTCADAIIRLLSSPAKALETNLVINSACYTPLTVDTATWLSAVYQYDATAGTFVAAAGQPKFADAPSKGHFEDMLEWFDTLMADTFA